MKTVKRLRYRSWLGGVVLVVLAVLALGVLPCNADTVVWYRFDTTYSGGVPSDGRECGKLWDSSTNGFDSLWPLAAGDGYTSSDITHRLGVGHKSILVNGTNTVNFGMLRFVDGNRYAFDIGYNSGAYFTTSNATVEWFMDLSSIPTNSAWRTIVRHGRQNFEHFDIRIQNDINTRKVVSEVLSNIGGRDDWQLSANLVDGEGTPLVGWHHIAVVMEQGPDSRIRIYIDGQVATQSSLGNWATTADVGTAGVTTLGAYDGNGTPGTHDYTALYSQFEGDMDEFRWSNVALSPSEFLQIPPRGTVLVIR